ncbi:MAG TPA: 2'-5' RNA ligase family protein [Parafilimonas sp.]|nr:2'-5' RNA ligase family protein [Parafilimonas sp.]
MLYFIAIIPPKEVCDEITDFKKDIATRFESKAALRIIPHITLKAPFQLPASDHDRVLDWFQKAVISVSPFVQELKNFGSFKNGRSAVIFVKPEMNNGLDQLQKEVLTNFVDHFSAEQVMKSETDFHPHITIGYRDLRPSMFKQAWAEYRLKQYSAAFTVTSFDLLQHDKHVWNSISNFVLPDQFNNV